MPTPILFQYHTFLYYSSRPAKDLNERRKPNEHHHAHWCVAAVYKTPTEEAAVMRRSFSNRWPVRCVTATHAASKCVGGTWLSLMHENVIIIARRSTKVSNDCSTESPTPLPAEDVSQLTNVCIVPVPLLLFFVSGPTQLWLHFLLELQFGQFNARLGRNVPFSTKLATSITCVVCAHMWLCL